MPLKQLTDLLHSGLWLRVANATINDPCFPKESRERICVAVEAHARRIEARREAKAADEQKEQEDGFKRAQQIARQCKDQLAAEDEDKCWEGFNE